MKTKLILVVIIFFGVFGLAKNSFAAAPVLNFSDLTSGPATGLGDGHGSGVIVTVWGNNLGSSQGTSEIYYKDSTGNAREAAYVYYWCNADGASGGGPVDLYANPVSGAGGSGHKMQEIAFSIPAGSATGAGIIYVVTSGGISNTLPFTVRSGNIYYININATGSNSGTWANPWTSPQSFLNTAAAGDTGYFMTGTYSGHYGDSASISSVFVFRPSRSGGAIGTATMPVAYVGYPGQTVVFQAKNTSASDDNKGIFLYPATLTGDDPQYYVWSKLKFSTWGPCFTTNGSVANSNGGTGWRLIGDDFNGLQNETNDQSGVLGLDGLTQTVYGCNIHGGRSNSHYDHAIYMGTCPAGGVAPNPAIGFDIGWNHVYDIENNYGALLSLNSGNQRCGVGEVWATTIIHNNIVDSANYSGNRWVQVFDLGQSEGPSSPGVYIYNNVFIGGSLLTAESGNVFVENNTFYGFTPPINGVGTVPITTVRYGDIGRPLESITVKNNIIYAAPAPAGDSQYTGYYHTDTNDGFTVSVDRH